MDEIPDEGVHLRSNLNYLVSIEVATFIQIGGIAVLEVLLDIQNVHFFLLKHHPMHHLSSSSS